MLLDIVGNLKKCVQCQKIIKDFNKNYYTYVLYIEQYVLKLGMQPQINIKSTHSTEKQSTLTHSPHRRFIGAKVLKSGKTIVASDKFTKHIMHLQ